MPSVEQEQERTRLLEKVFLRERLHSMDLWINKIQMRPSMHVLEDHLARLEDRLNNQHKEIAIL